MSTTNPPELVECPMCTLLHPGRTLTCPGCGSHSKELTFYATDFDPEDREEFRLNRIYMGLWVA